MSQKVISLYKFVGSVGLGLLTGLSYTTLSHTAPTLLTLPSASTSKSTLRSLLPRLELSILSLSSLSSTALLSAYLWSPPRAKHPYLLYAALAAVLPYTEECYRWIRGQGTMKEWERFVMKGGSAEERGIKGAGRAVTPPSGASSDEEWEVEASGMKTASSSTTKGSGAAKAEGEVNGEAVKEAVRSWRRDMLVKCVSYGAGFAMMVVGIWGDGTHQTQVVVV